MEKNKVRVVNKVEEKRRVVYREVTNTVRKKPERNVLNYVKVKV